MASFTYTVWSDSNLPKLVTQLIEVFGRLDFSPINPLSGKIHLWNDREEKIEPTLELIKSIELPLSIQWWREKDDISVSFDRSAEAGGHICHITLVGLPRSEQAEIAKLLILLITPEKQNFPDDFPVFQLSAQ